VTAKVKSGRLHEGRIHEEVSKWSS